MAALRRRSPRAAEGPRESGALGSLAIVYYGFAGCAHGPDANLERQSEDSSELARWIRMQRPLCVAVREDNQTTRRASPRWEACASAPGERVDLNQGDRPVHVAQSPSLQLDGTVEPADCTGVPGRRSRSRNPHNVTLFHRRLATRTGLLGRIRRVHSASPRQGLRPTRTQVAIDVCAEDVSENGPLISPMREPRHAPLCPRKGFFSV